ncbi:MAG: LamG-like jellyroll fold domain-containing protein [Cellulophaga fucicola]
MKNLKYIVICMVTALFLYSCDQGIDNITQVVAGADETAPAVKINYPTEGTRIRVVEDVTSITIDFEVTDDIEIASIDVKIDNNSIQSFSSFKDYRRVLIDNLVFNNLVDGTHQLTIIATDLDGKTTEASTNFEKEPPYKPLYDGETFYMPFDNDYLELITLTEATKVGTPNFAGESVLGTNAYAGAADSYLNYSTEGLTGSTEFSATFWYKLNATPDRSGILVMGPPDTENAGFPDVQNLRTSGFRFFREGSPDRQEFKLIVGNGSADIWFGGGDNTAIAASSGEWVQIAFTISDTKCVMYFDGEIVAEGEFSGIDWTGCDILSIASGAPRFTEWGHLSDQSLIDELRLYNKALTQEEIQSIRDADL